MLSLFGSRPATRLRWWAVGLGAAYVLLYAGIVVVMAMRTPCLPVSAASTTLQTYSHLLAGVSEEAAVDINKILT